MEALNNNTFTGKVELVEDLVRILSEYDSVQLRALLDTTMMVKNGKVLDKEHRIHMYYCGLVEHYNLIKGEKDE